MTTGREETLDLQNFFRHALQDMGNGCLDHWDASTEPAQGKPGKAEGSSMDAFMEMLLAKKGSGTLITDRFQVLTKFGK